MPSISKHSASGRWTSNAEFISCSSWLCRRGLSPGAVCPRPRPAHRFSSARVPPLSLFPAPPSRTVRLPELSPGPAPGLSSSHCHFLLYQGLLRRLEAHQAPPPPPPPFSFSVISCRGRVRHPGAEIPLPNVSFSLSC